MRDHYSITEAAARLSRVWPFTVTPDTLRRWVRQGRLPALRSPTGRYYLERPVIDLLSDSKRFPDGRKVTPDPHSD